MIAVSRSGLKAKKLSDLVEQVFLFDRTTVSFGGSDIEMYLPKRYIGPVNEYTSDNEANVSDNNLHTTESVLWNKLRDGVPVNALNALIRRYAKADPEKWIEDHLYSGEIYEDHGMYYST